MAGKNDKWVLFKNYMHNELGITKEDIREWINDAIREEVKNIVHNAYGRCDLESFIKKEIYDNTVWGKSFKESIRREVAQQLVEKIKVEMM